MIKRYCDRCGQQIDEGVHAWYVLELHGTDGEFRHKELCEECYEYLCEKDEAPKADRKTEPTMSVAKIARLLSIINLLVSCFQKFANTSRKLK